MRHANTGESNMTSTTSLKRSILMSNVRQRGTTPELQVAQLLRPLGNRFRSNTKALPGSPDFSNSRLRLTVFVHGCFWHRHSGCRACTTPKSNREFWAEKFRANVRRDRSVARRLRALGYSVITVWECQLKTSAGRVKVATRLGLILGTARARC